ncbi:MAG: type II secretion system F family protein [Planctomycetes bacterium]|nr:type II secretion system F family protein [Planctomycetota bacterium]
MPTFQYRALNRSGSTIKGSIDADNPQVAKSILAERGLFIDSISQVESSGEIEVTSSIKKSYKLKLSEKHRVELIRQLATALHAHLPLMSALQVVGQQNAQPNVRQLVAEISDSIKSGQSLSYAMGQYPNIFEKLDISMVSVGESAGTLDQSMMQLADLSEASLETKNEITTASLYPAFVLILGLVSVSIIVTFILPRILTTLAADLESQPWPTQVLFAVSNFFKSPPGWIFLGMLAVLFFLFKQWCKSSRGKYLWDGMKLRLPVIGPVQQKWATSRLARTLGTLTRGGVNIVEALQISRNTLGNEALAREVDNCAGKVRTGSSLAEALNESKRFEPLLIQIVTMGEQTGEFAEMMLAAADAFDRDSRVAIKRFMAIFPATLILILALVIGFMVAGTLLPIVSIETAIPGL